LNKFSSVTSLAAGFAEENETTRKVLSGVSVVTGVVSMGEAFVKPSNINNVVLKTNQLGKTVGDVKTDFSALVKTIDDIPTTEVGKLKNKEAIVEFLEANRKELKLSEDVTKVALAKLKNIRIVNYTPTSGTRIIANPNKTTTILGRWVDDMEEIKKYMIDIDFNVGTTFGKVTSNKGGFNFLDIEKVLSEKAGDKFFELYNKPWLDAAIKRGDDIVLATKPEKSKLFDFTKNKLTTFGEEVNHLINKNHKPLNLTDMGWDEAKNIISEILK
jgi:hypothetical protein